MADLEEEGLEVVDLQAAYFGPIAAEQDIEQHRLVRHCRRKKFTGDLGGGLGGGGLEGGGCTNYIGYVINCKELINYSTA